MDIKKLIISFVLIGILSQGAMALSFSYNATAVNDKIEINEQAEYTLELKNKLAQSQTLRVYSLDYPTWDVRTDPIMNPMLIDLEPSEKKTLDLVVQPLDLPNILRGPHFINLKISSKTTNEIVNVPLKVVVTSRDYLIQGYVPTVLAKVNIPKKLDPRDPLPIDITIDNQNIINYSTLTLKFESDIDYLNEEIDFSLGPKEKETFSFNKELDSLTTPRKITYTVSVVQKEDGRIIVEPVTANIEVTEYVDTKEADIKKSFLKTEREITFTTNSMQCSEEIMVESTFFQSLFSSTKPKAQVLKDGSKRYFVWEITELGEGNTVTVKVTENYRYMFFGLIIAVVLVFAYFRYRSPLTITKKVNNITRKDSGIHTMKVGLQIKNRSNQKIDAIELKDSMPNIVDIEGGMSIGTLKPDKILKHIKKGHVVVWNINDLDVGEERVLSYNVKSRLPILGDLTLPVATAKFRYNKKDQKTASNRVNVSS